MDTESVISPEVRGLFDTIRSQARKYTEALDYFNRESSEFEGMKRDLYESLIKFNYESKQLMDDCARQVQDSLQFVESKAETNSVIYNDLDSIRQLRDSLLKLHERLKNQVIEFDSQLLKLKNKIDIEFESAILKSNAKIDKELENLTNKIDARLNLKLKQIDGKFLSLDQKLWSLSDSKSRESNLINEETENIKSQLAGIKVANMEFRKEISVKVDQLSQSIINYLKPIDDIIIELNKMKDGGKIAQSIDGNSNTQFSTVNQGDWLLLRDQQDKLRKNLYIIAAVSISISVLGIIISKLGLI